MNNSSNKFLEYYSRKDVQEQIVKSAKSKEIAVAYSDGNFGKRPDVLQYPSDVLELARQGAVSFHISEEIWKNPLQLRTGLVKRELDDLRIGWDLVLDIDCKHLEYSKIAAVLVIEAIKYCDVKSTSVKFSGNHGFHIGIPFKAFPGRVNNLDTKMLFPEGLRTIALYIKEVIRNHLSKELLKHGIEEIAKNTNQKQEDLYKNGKFDPFTVVDIDTILISSRHLFRAPYSINEKSGLVSLPIKPEDVAKFDKESARPEKIEAKLSFLDDEDVMQDEASPLIMQAFDFASKNKSSIVNEEPKKERVYEENLEKIPKDFFPGCIKKILEGNMTDGRKRALFILINFLKSTNYSNEEMKEIINEWNAKNPIPLKQGYVNSQLLWHVRQNKKILPPNCDNSNYYSAMGIKDNDEICARYKNPVNCANMNYRRYLESMKGKRKKQ